MTIDALGSGHTGALLAKQRAALDWSQLQVGQNLTLRVMRQIGQGRYSASAGGEQHIVDSKVPLHDGDVVRAKVVAVGDRVELQYLGTQSQENATEAGVELEVAAGSFAELQQRFGVALSAAEAGMVGTLSSSAGRPEIMASGGLYLGKLGLKLDVQGLEALYSARVWRDEQTREVFQPRDGTVLLDSIHSGHVPALHRLANMLADSVDSPNRQSNGVEVEAENAAAAIAEGMPGQSQQHSDFSDQHADSDQPQLLAQQLLNSQDNGSLAYHYGTMPLLIADQLIEIDLVLFRERKPASTTQQMRKLVMSLRTESLGRVQIVAQSVDSHLSVTINSEATEYSSALSAHAREVHELVSRLGWDVDSVAYRTVREPARAAEAIVRHVLAAGTVDATV